MFMARLSDGTSVTLAVEPNASAGVQRQVCCCKVEFPNFPLKGNSTKMFIHCFSLLILLSQVFF